MGQLGTVLVLVAFLEFASNLNSKFDFLKNVLISAVLYFLFIFNSFYLDFNVTLYNVYCLQELPRSCEACKASILIMIAGKSSSDNYDKFNISIRFLVSGNFKEYMATWRFH